jgi:hypothetical protein
MEQADRVQCIATREVFRRRLECADDPVWAKAYRSGLIRCHLDLGDFGSAWRELRKLVEAERLFEAGGRKRWTGEPVAGRTVFVVDEWGFGDSIQFIRYGKAVRDMGASVTVVCRPELFRLYERLDFADRVIARQCPGQEFADVEFDVYAPVMDLPSLVPPSVPSYVSYLSVADADVSRWTRQLACGMDLKVGVVWSTGFVNGRSRAAADFSCLADVPGVQLYSLQKGPAAAEVPNLPAAIALSDSLTDFYDTACAIMALDLVVGVDTSVTYLARALGRPVWTIIVNQPSWRWFGGPRLGTPWYPSTHLYYEAHEEPWPVVLGRVERDLSARYEITLSLCGRMV